MPEGEVLYMIPLRDLFSVRFGVLVEKTFKSYPPTWVLLSLYETINALKASGMVKFVYHPDYKEIE